MKVLICIDMQYAFTSGSLANPAAAAIVPDIAAYIRRFDGQALILTRDTHHEDYLNTYEGKHLPIVHCVYGTDDWVIEEEIYDAALAKSLRPNCYIDVINKPTFGYASIIADSIKSAQAHVRVDDGNSAAKVTAIEFVGTATEICVISNVLGLKPFFPDADFIVHKDMCAGLTPEGQEAALKVMEACQVIIK